MVKNFACNATDLGLIPRLRRSPGEGNGYPLQYSCLENAMNRGKSPTQPDFLSKGFLVLYQKYIQESFLSTVSMEVVFLTCSWKIQIENTSLAATSSQACWFRN